MITLPNTLEGRQAMLDEMLDDRSVSPLRQEFRREAAQKAIALTGGVPCANMTEAAAAVVSTFRKVLSRVPTEHRAQFLMGAVSNAREMRTAGGAHMSEVVEALEQLMLEVWCP